jgi:tRNA(adenine34) deaminase
MEEALRSAQRALEAGEVPVGAIVVCQGRVVGRGWNRNLSDCDPSAHAEIVALRDAGRTLGNHRLGDCELFATIEPCAMCAGAAVHARIRRLVYGADDPKAGAIHSVLQVVNHPGVNHRMEVRGGVLAGRSAEMLQEFFRNRRWALVDTRESVAIREDSLGNSLVPGLRDCGAGTRAPASFEFAQDMPCRRSRGRLALGAAGVDARRTAAGTAALRSVVI